MINAASLAFAEGYPREDAVLAEARQRADVVGVAPVGAGGGAAAARKATAAPPPAPTGATPTTSARCRASASTASSRG